MEAVLVVDQADIDLVKIDHEVDMKIESARLDTFSVVSRSSLHKTCRVCRRIWLRSHGGVDTEMDPSGRLKPMSTSYQARVPLEDVKVPLRAGYRGYAKVYVGWKSLAGDFIDSWPAHSALKCRVVFSLV